MIISFEKCYICGRISHFSIEDDARLLREATCEFCNSSIRNSDTAKILVKSLLNKDTAIKECMDELQKFNILEAQASGSINQLLKTSLNYTCFEYFDNIEPGQIKGQILCNSQESLTFEDNSFDVVISQDVLEHLVNPLNAISEIRRVLKTSGKHIFTVPLHQGRKTICRSNLPKVYHEDPLRDSCALVQFDWGDDIIDIINQQGMDTIAHQLHNFYSNDELTNTDLISYDEYFKTPSIVHYRYNSIVLESTKNNSEALFTKDTVSDTFSILKALDDATSLQLIKFGPENTIAEDDFNIQPNGESALWCRTRNARKTTCLVLNNFKLKSYVNDDSTLVTAIVPKWLFRFPGEYSLYLCDTKTNEKSNELKFIVNKKNSDLNQQKSEKSEISSLQSEIINLYKELESYKQQKPYKLNGLEMLTRHELPWIDNYNWKLFRETCDKMKETFEFGSSDDIGNEVILHVGLHKTGSTSIQYSLFSEENILLLNNKDCLYPRSLENNHTIPICSAFYDRPEEFIVNIKEGYSIDEIKELNKKNLENLRVEIANSRQKKLIISGEGISLLSINNLISLKKYLSSMYSLPPKIRVIIYTRNPISWAASMVQENLKHGLEYRTSLHEIEEDLRSLYRTRIGKFVDVFGQKNVNIYCFENAIKHEFSITGHFLSILGFSCNEISKFKMYTTNVSMSQMAADILSYINFKIPLIKDGKLNSKRSSADFIPILDIRGPKFNVNYYDKIRLLEKCQNDIKWLKNNYNIDYSNTICREGEPINVYLDNDTIETLINVHRKLSPILKNLFKEYFEIQLKSNSDIRTTMQLTYLINKLNE